MGVTNLDVLGFVPLGCVFHGTFYHKVLMKTTFPVVAVVLLWCYPFSCALRGQPSETAAITAKRLTLLLLELVLPSITTSLVQVLMPYSCTSMCFCVTCLARAGIHLH